MRSHSSYLLGKHSIILIVYGTQMHNYIKFMGASIFYTRQFTVPWIATCWTNIIPQISDQLPRLTYIFISLNF